MTELVTFDEVFEDLTLVDVLDRDSSKEAWDNMILWLGQNKEAEGFDEALGRVVGYVEDLGKEHNPSPQPLSQMQNMIGMAGDQQQFTQQFVQEQSERYYSPFVVMTAAGTTKRLLITNIQGIEFMHAVGHNIDHDSDSLGENGQGGYPIQEGSPANSPENAHVLKNYKREVAPTIYGVIDSPNTQISMQERASNIESYAAEVEDGDEVDIHPLLSDETQTMTIRQIWGNNPPENVGSMFDPTADLFLASFFRDSNLNQYTLHKALNSFIRLASGALIQERRALGSSYNPIREHVMSMLPGLERTMQYEEGEIDDREFHPDETIQESILYRTYKALSKSRERFEMDDNEFVDKLVGQVFTFHAAATFTTRAGMHVVWENMSKIVDEDNPDKTWSDSIQDTIDEAIERSGSDDISKIVQSVDSSTIHKVLEMWRHNPPLWVTLAMKFTNPSLAGKYEVLVNIHELNNDEDAWGEHSGRYSPNIWDGINLDTLDRSWSHLRKNGLRDAKDAYWTFGQPPRGCVGQTSAMYSTLAHMVMLRQNGLWFEPTEEPEKGVRKGPFGPALGYNRHIMKVKKSA